MLWLVLCYFLFFKQKTAYELRISDRSSDVCSSDLRARRRLLLRHRRVEARAVDCDALRTQRILGQVIGKAESVVEPERDVAGQRRALAHPHRRLVKQPQPLVERLAELDLLALQRFGNQRLGADQLGIGGDRKSTRLNSSH